MHIRMLCIRMLSIRMLTSMYIRIGIGGARMPPPLTSMYVHTYVCMSMYIRMLCTYSSANEYVCTYIRIGIGGAQMPRPLTSMYVHTYRYWMWHPLNEYVCTYV
jgi:hypothetical protein